MHEQRQETGKGSWFGYGTIAIQGSAFVCVHVPAWDVQ